MPEQNRGPRTSTPKLVYCFTVVILADRTTIFMAMFLLAYDEVNRRLSNIIPTQKVEGYNFCCRKNMPASWIEHETELRSTNPINLTSSLFK